MYDVICSGAEISLPRNDCSNKSQKTKGKVYTKVYRDVWQQVLPKVNRCFMKRMHGPLQFAV